MEETINMDMLKARVALQHAVENENIRARLAQYGFNEQMLYRGFSLYEVAQQKLEWEYGKPTTHCEHVEYGTADALRRLSLWMVDFVAASRKAMRTQPHYLKVMGISE